MPITYGFTTRVVPPGRESEAKRAEDVQDLFGRRRGGRLPALRSLVRLRQLRAVPQTMSSL